MYRSCLQAVLFIVSSLLFMPCQSIAQADENRLEPGVIISKFINTPSAHKYKVVLQEGQFAIFNLQQKGIDVEMTTYDVDGNKLESFDSPNGTKGPEIAVLDAVKTGAYSLEVKPLESKKKFKSGSYQLEMLEPNDSPAQQLDKVLELLSQREALPGFAVSVMTKDSVYFQKGYGYADIEHKKPFTVHSIQNIGSTSKTLIGLSLMKLVEQGKLSLDSEINSILPFPVYNPYFPEIPITVKHLANHTSTIKETQDYERSYVLDESVALDKSVFHKSEFKDFKFYKKNKEMLMAQFLKNIVHKDGDWYSKKNFLKVKPGTQFSYTNAGATLAAYIVELVSGMPFDQFTQKNIIEPLGLQNTGWTADQVDMTKHTQRYGYKKNPLPAYHLITYPDGGLISNVADLSTYLMALMKGYQGESKLLSAASFQEMMVHQQFDTGRGQYGLFWEVSRRKNRMGHNGGDPGILSLMYFYPETNMGTTIMCNMIPAMTGPEVVFLILNDVLERYGQQMTAAKASIELSNN